MNKPATPNPAIPPDWTGEDLGRLRLMWGEGVLIDAIARELGRTPGAVQIRACILKLPKRGIGNGRVPVNGRSHTGLPTRLRYEDDPRAEAEFDPLPAAIRGDVTAVLMGDPAPGAGLFRGPPCIR